MTRNEIRMSKANRRRNILIVILCILTVAVIAVFAIKKIQTNYKESFNIGAEFGLMTTCADVNWLAQTVKEEDYVSYQEAALRMLANYSEETVSELRKEAAHLFKREYLADLEFKEINDITGFKDGYLVYSSIGILSMSVEFEQITQEEYDMLSEEMENLVENPNHVRVRAFLDHFMERVDISNVFDEI